MSLSKRKLKFNKIMEGEPTKESKKPVWITKITEAIASQDKQKLYATFCEINNILTGGNSGDFQDGVSAKQFLRDIEKFLSGSQKGFASLRAYLGDGGISRLILQIDEENLSLDISPVSSDKVKKKWDEL